MPIIHALHDPQSKLLDAVSRLLRAGKVVIVDISLVSGRVGLQIAGLLLNNIFTNNQESFTDPDRGRLIPTIVVLEEAQSVIGKSAKEDSPFVQWAKEGRKYSLGAMFVTQQPGSIAPELLSQGDNFFAFHLLSAHDLKTLQYHNAHFSDDVLGHLLNEPIRGNAYFWAAPHQPFVLPARILNFEVAYGGDAKTDTDAAKAIDTGLDELLSVEQRLVSRLAPKAKDLIESGTVALESLAGDNSVWLVYKPRLAAVLAEHMDNDERVQHCSGGQDDRTFVCDQILDQVVAVGLSGGTVNRVKGRRDNDNRQGVFYCFPRESVSADVQAKDTVTAL